MTVAAVRVVRESEDRAGWVFEVEVDRAGVTTGHKVRLGWGDYDYWSHGVAGPARVIEALVRYMAERESPSLRRAEFDAARARREFPEVDKRLPEMLTG